MTFLPILLLGIFAVGCSASSMTPAHRMTTGDVTIDLAITEPGATFIPKIAAGASVGLGVGDLTLQTATSFFAASATAAPRLYFGDLAELKIETTYWAQLVNERLLPFRAIFLVPRVGYSLQGDAGWFWGAQNITILPIETADVSDRVAAGNVTSVIGGYVGYGWRFGSWSYQAELSGSPIPIADAENLDLTTYLGGTWHLGFSAHYWIGR